MCTKKIMLIILDGWGIAKDKKASAIDQAKTPFIDSLYSKYPNSFLETSGKSVGLPEGQMGNSEVGHMNIGAGRVVHQTFMRINKAIEEKTFKNKSTLQNTFDYVKKKQKKLHLMGLVSDGGVHSHVNHLKALLESSYTHGLKNIFIHAFTDGRDTDPRSGIHFLSDLENSIKNTNAQISTIIGRYYAMDRDNRWERIQIAYEALVHGKGNHTNYIQKALLDSYQKSITDEFIQPIIHTTKSGLPIGLISEGDAVICFNFRTDRGREITQALTQKDFPEQNMYKMNLYYVTMTNYDESFKGVQTLFKNQHLENTLGETLSKYGKKQIRIAETEKYPHVTFFFSGGRETPFEGEHRILCPSPKVATYDLKPEMSAYDIKESIKSELHKQVADFICLNFANPDMVGHTGVFKAAIKACETVDIYTKEIITEALKNNYSCLLIADHGNSDKMINSDGSPNTAHTLNPVPCILIEKTNTHKLKNGILSDIAPTILNLMNIDIPKR